MAFLPASPRKCTAHLRVLNRAEEIYRAMGTCLYQPSTVSENISPSYYRGGLNIIASLALRSPELKQSGGTRMLSITF